MADERGTIQRIVEIVLRVTNDGQRKITETARGLSSLDRVLRRGAEATARYTKATTAAQREIERYERLQRAAAVTTRRAAGETANFERAITRANKVSSTFGATLTSLAGVLGAGLGFNAAIRGAGEFSTAIAEVGTLVDDGTRSTEQLARDVQGLGAEFGVSDVGTAQALYTAISSGAEAGAEANDLLRTAIQLSIGGVTDQQSAVSVLTSVLNAYGREMGEAEQLSDQLFETVKLGVTNIQQLSQFMFQATPTAAALGVSIEEVLSSVVALTKQGTPTNVALTGIRNALVALSRPTEDLAALYERLEVSGGENLIATRGFQGALDALSDSVDGSVEGMVRLLGSQEATQAALGLTGVGAVEFTAALDAMGESAGNTARAADEVNRAFGRDLEATANAVARAFTSIGAALAPIISPLLAFVRTIANAATTFAEAQPLLAGIVAVVGGLGVALLPAVASFNLLAAAAARANLSLASLPPTMGLVTGSVTAATGAIGAFTAATLALLRTPLGAALGLVAGAFVGVSVAARAATSATTEYLNKMREARAASDSISAIEDELGRAGLATDELGDAFLELRRQARIDPVRAQDSLREAERLRDDLLRVQSELEQGRTTLAEQSQRAAAARRTEELNADRELAQNQLDTQQEALAQAQQSLRSYVREYQDSRRQAAQIEERFRNQQRSIQQELFDLELSRLSEAEQQARLEQELADQVVAAQQQIASARTREEAAEALQAAERVAQVGRRLQSEEQVREALEASLRLSEEATRQGIAIERERQRAAEENRQATEAQIATLGEAVEVAKQRVEELGEIEPVIEIDSGAIAEVELQVEALEARLEALQQPRVIPLEIQEQNVQARAQGGPILRASRGARVPGWGGGDRVRALLEPGEHVIRKDRAAMFRPELDMINRGPYAAVRRLLAAMRSQRLQAGGIAGDTGSPLPVPLKMQTGGAVPAPETAGPIPTEMVRIDLGFGDEVSGPFYAAPDAVRGLRRSMSRESTKRGRRVA